MYYYYVLKLSSWHEEIISKTNVSNYESYIFPFYLYLPVKTEANQPIHIK